MRGCEDTHGRSMQESFPPPTTLSSLGTEHPMLCLGKIMFCTIIHTFVDNHVERMIFHFLFINTPDPATILPILQFLV